MKFSIRYQLIAFTFCIVLLVGGSISLYSIYQGRQRILSDFERDAREITTLISTNTADDLYFLNVHALRLRLESSRTNPDISYTYVTDTDGAVLSDGTQENLLRDQKLTDSFSQMTLHSASWISRVEGELLKVGGPVVAPDSSRIGYLQVGFSLKSVDKVVSEATRTSFYVTAICLGVGVFLAFILATGFTRPIFAIVRASMEIGAGKLDTRISLRRSDELGKLADSINQMAGALRTREVEAKQAEKKLEARYQQLEALHEVSQAILGSPDLKTILEEILKKTLAITSLDIGNIRLFNLRGEMLHGTFQGYRDPENIPRHHTHSTGPTGGVLVPEALATKKTLVVEDVPSGDGLRTFKREGVQSAIVIPISTEKELLGVKKLLGAIEVGSRTPRSFEPDEVRILEAVGNQTGVAVQKAWLFEESQRRAREQEALNAIATAASQSLRLDEILQIALDKVREITGRERVNIRLKDPVTGEVRLRAHLGFSPEEIEDLRRRAPHKMSDQVFASGEPLVIHDSKEVSPGTLLERSRSVAWIPIKTGAKVVGILGISDNKSVPFSKSEIDLLLAIGNVIGIAIENARLFEETQRNLERVKALREIDQAITSTLDLRTVLDVLLEKIDLVLPYSATTVRLLNKESGAIEPVACRNLDEKEWKAERWRGGRGIPNVVFETKAPVTISNVQSDPQNRDQEFFRKHGLVSYLGVPLIVQNEVLGVISFYTKEEHDFSNEEVEFLSTLAGQAAIAIHNSEVYEEMATLASNLSRANRVKDEFLSVMSHELRTPLNVVMGYTAMIKDRMLGEINPEQEKALEKVISRARDQLTMITNILQATQLEAEGVKVENQEVSLRDFLDDLRSSYEGSFGKEISIVWDYPSDLPVIKTDSEKLNHILQNLINNAIKFTEKGNVTISARYLNGSRVGESTQQKGDGDSQNGVVELKVSDTGIGIDEENFPLIFERFRQVDSSETRRYGGVGIGLYIVKKFTEMLGGQVEVQSEPGKGSTFTVTIPVAIHQQVGREEAKGLMPSA